MDQTSSSSSDDIDDAPVGNEEEEEEEDVVIGPDLNPTRSRMDRKLYRHVTLSNGLKCVLISDTVAMRQRMMAGGRRGYGSDDDDESEDDSDDDDGDDDDELENENDDDDEDEDEEDDDGLRKAAAALLVNVGSYHDPPYLQGLSHFLEHMLFLGTETFPSENAYDQFLSKAGGDDNAYTDMEHTLYHFCVPQDEGGTVLWRALEMFAAFFKCPLLRGEMAGRELNAVESEFELNRKDDECRLGQVMSYTCGMDGDAPIMGREFERTTHHHHRRRRSSKDDDDATKEEEGDCETKEEEVKPFHPFAKFAWGNMNSLKTEPESNGVDVMKELREHYHNHYYARNMRLVVLAGYELDEIQRRVVQHFGDVPADPRIRNDDDDDEGVVVARRRAIADGVTNLRPYELPFHPSSLTRLYRILPVRRQHTLALTWQIRSISSHWRTKPSDYLAHLIGHEASGSVLALLKERGWATGLSAGTGEDGEADASTHALFCVQISLSKCGMEHWEDVVEAAFAYVGMLKFHFLEGHANDEGEKKEGLAPWIHDELKSIAELSYRYADEGDVTDIVEGVAENMAPWYNLPEERILDGDSLLFDDAVDHDAVKTLLFDYFTPQNLRVDLMSSLFGCDADFDDSAAQGEEEEKKESEDDGTIRPMVDADVVGGSSSNDDCEEPSLFDKEKAGPPFVEPRFGTKFWEEEISKDLIQLWTDAAEPRLPPSELELDLPPKNPYIPSKFDLKPLPADDSEHPLLNCSVKVCVNVGRKKSWFPAAVTKYQTKKNAHRLSLSYEDEGEKWHRLDSPETYDKFEEDHHVLEVGHEGSFDDGKVKFRVTAVPRDGEGIVFSFGDSGHDDDVEDGIAFPPIPPSAPASRLPLLIYDKRSFKLWHLQDRKFKRPLADLRIKFVCEGMNDSALNQACMALFCNLCADALAETCYLAGVSELGSSLYPTDSGLSVRVHGFDHNLLALAEEVLRVVMSFRGRDGERDLPSTIKAGRFDACLEVQLRQWSNAGMDASAFSASLRLLCIRPSSVKSKFAKLRAIRGITAEKFVEVMNKLLKRLSVEAFYHGNVDRKDADNASAMISKALTATHVGLPKKKLPAKLVAKLKHAIDHHRIVVPTVDPKDPNTAVEIYFQFGKDDNSSNAIRQRVLVDLLEHVLDEPLYNQIRTKETFGYEVSCGARWTYGVLGMSFRVVTASKSADEASSRIDEFLRSFRSELESMDQETFMEHLVGLAKNKLESFDSLEEETGSHWTEIIEGRYDFEAYRKEVLTMRSISKEELIAAYDEWLHPLCEKGKPKKRRRMVVHVIGSGEGASSSGRPLVENDKAVGDEIDHLLDKFHASAKKESWGRIIFGSPELRKADTV